ncbi:hypothetical protein PPERSA_11837 [Pseudocohnilembus persalinus]|uniref:Uncharacterized protein n=1 Tax=Pseudocohnilembus persalinus TaxID=266149 RepID=A0A0V0QJV3_PSEPJ|nr:hypothetical protein PPERSA_11837 [Pseudocohnilembus persalinus]|eukprot:KRX02497.1 hypothetical protein PPERSA_11837 [Pseudocohnilembus persalinus]
MSENLFLQKLSLQNNMIEDLSVEKLLGNLQNNSSLRVLDLSYNKNDTLQSLDLSYNNYGMDSLESVLQGLEKNKFLKKLKLTGIQVGQLHIHQIIQILERNSSLQQLNIDIQLSDDDADLILKLQNSLSINYSLIELNSQKLNIGIQDKLTEGIYTLLRANQWIQQNYEDLIKNKAPQCPEFLRETVIKKLDHIQSQIGNSVSCQENNPFAFLYQSYIEQSQQNQQCQSQIAQDIYFSTAKQQQNNKILLSLNTDYSDVSNQRGVTTDDEKMDIVEISNMNSTMINNKSLNIEENNDNCQKNDNLKENSHFQQSKGEILLCDEEIEQSQQYQNQKSIQSNLLSLETLLGNQKIASQIQEFGKEVNSIKQNLNQVKNKLVEQNDQSKDKNQEQNQMNEYKKDEKEVETNNQKQIYGPPDLETFVQENFEAIYSKMKQIQKQTKKLKKQQENMSFSRSPMSTATTKSPSAQAQMLQNQNNNQQQFFSSKNMLNNKKEQQEQKLQIENRQINIQDQSQKLDENQNQSYQNQSTSMDCYQQGEQKQQLQQQLQYQQFQTQIPDLNTSNYSNPLTHQSYRNMQQPSLNIQENQINQNHQTQENKQQYQERQNQNNFEDYQNVRNFQNSQSDQIQQLQLQQQDFNLENLLTQKINEIFEQKLMGMTQSQRSLQNQNQQIQGHTSQATNSNHNTVNSNKNLSNPFYDKTEQNLQQQLYQQQINQTNYYNNNIEGQDVIQDNQVYDYLMDKSPKMYQQQIVSQCTDSSNLESSSSRQNNYQTKLQKLQKVRQQQELRDSIKKGQLYAFNQKKKAEKENISKAQNDQKYFEENMKKFTFYEIKTDDLTGSQSSKLRHEKCLQQKNVQQQQNKDKSWDNCKIESQLVYFKGKQLFLLIKQLGQNEKQFDSIKNKSLVNSMLFSFDIENNQIHQILQVQINFLDFVTDDLDNIYFIHFPNPKNDSQDRDRYTISQFTISDKNFETFKEVLGVAPKERKILNCGYFQEKIYIYGSSSKSKYDRTQNSFIFDLNFRKWEAYEFPFFDNNEKNQKSKIEAEINEHFLECALMEENQIFYLEPGQIIKYYNYIQNNYQMLEDGNMNQQDIENKISGFDLQLSVLNIESQQKEMFKLKDFLKACQSQFDPFYKKNSFNKQNYMKTSQQKLKELQNQRIFIYKKQNQLYFKSQDNSLFYSFDISTQNGSIQNLGIILKNKEIENFNTQFIDSNYIQQHTIQRDFINGKNQFCIANESFYYVTNDLNQIILFSIQEYSKKSKGRTQCDKDI